MTLSFGTFGLTGSRGQAPSADVAHKKDDDVAISGFDRFEPVPPGAALAGLDANLFASASELEAQQRSAAEASRAAEAEVLSTGFDLYSSSSARAPSAAVNRNQPGWSNRTVESSSLAQAAAAAAPEDVEAGLASPVPSSAPAPLATGGKSRRLKHGSDSESDYDSDSESDSDFESDFDEDGHPRLVKAHPGHAINVGAGWDYTGFRREGEDGQMHLSLLSTKLRGRSDEERRKADFESRVAFARANALNQIRVTKDGLIVIPADLYDSDGIPALDDVAKDLKMGEAQDNNAEPSTYAMYVLPPYSTSQEPHAATVTWEKMKASMAKDAQIINEDSLLFDNSHKDFHTGDAPTAANERGLYFMLSRHVTARLVYWVMVGLFAGAGLGIAVLALAEVDGLYDQKWNLYAAAVDIGMPGEPVNVTDGLCLRVSYLTMGAGALLLVALVINLLRFFLRGKHDERVWGAGWLPAVSEVDFFYLKGLLSNLPAIANAAALACMGLVPAVSIGMTSAGAVAGVFGSLLGSYLFQHLAERNLARFFVGGKKEADMRFDAYYGFDRNSTEPNGANPFVALGKIVKPLATMAPKDDDELATAEDRIEKVKLRSDKPEMPAGSEKKPDEDVGYLWYLKMDKDENEYKEYINPDNQRTLSKVYIYYGLAIVLGLFVYITEVVTQATHPGQLRGGDASGEINRWALIFMGVILHTGYIALSILKYGAIFNLEMTGSNWFYMVMNYQVFRFKGDKDPENPDSWKKLRTFFWILFVVLALLILCSVPAVNAVAALLFTAGAHPRNNGGQATPASLARIVHMSHKHHFYGGVMYILTQSWLAVWCLIIACVVHLIDFTALEL